jgi:ClpP class serine protease
LDEALSSDAPEITLHINSPGGEIDGCLELCEKIRVLNTLKPIHAKISGYGCSAAYWIASACGDISATKTSIVGSLGVMAVLSPKEDGAHIFISSQTPLKNKDPETEEGACAVQQQIDALCHVFFSEVAKNRNTSLEIVSSEYGMGASFVGEQALKSGLIDKIEEHEFYPEKKKFQGHEKALSDLSAFVDVEKNEADEIFGLIKKFGV